LLADELAEQKVDLMVVMMVDYLDFCLAVQKAVL